MPAVLRVGRYRFVFFSNEGQEPPHIHIKAGGDEAKFWLNGPLGIGGEVPRFWGVSGGYSPLTPQNLALTTANPKEPNY